MTKGRTGEILFKQRAEALNYTVEDVSNNPDYWHRDIDALVTSPTGTTKSFECKWDGCICRTNNLYLELTNVHSKGGNGWYVFCEADYLAYGDAHAKKFYIIPMDKLRERVQKLPQRMARCDKDSTGLLVSLNDIKDIYTII